MEKLTVSQAESPETEVGSSVGDTTETELNRVNGLMHHDFTKRELRHHTHKRIHQIRITDVQSREDNSTQMFGGE